MDEMLQNVGPGSEKRKPPVATILIGVVIAIAIALSLWFVLQPPQSKPVPLATAVLPTKMSPSEEAYAKNIRIENVALSRAANFIHQEVTILEADAVNAGSQSVQGLVVTVEFFDDLHQVVLRETRGILTAPPNPLRAGERRNFQISFDRVPPSWNMQQPAVRVTSLQLLP